MAKGDKDAVQSAVQTNTSNAQSNLDTLRAQNGQQYGMFNSMYGPQFNQAQRDYGNGMGGYQNFLATMPNTGAMLSKFMGPSYANANPTNVFGGNGATQSGPSMFDTTGSGQPTTGSSSGPNALTGDPVKDKFISLYNKYGVKVGNNGVTDLNYWSGDAMKNASGDADYVTNRLESDLAGNGPDEITAADRANGVKGGSSGGGNSYFGAGSDWGMFGPAAKGYQNFADTGGFSPQDIQDIRARSIAPIRSIYSSAKRETDRAKALNPGLTNIPAAQAKLARESAYATSDATTNAEANIAGMRQQGKLAGNAGLAGIGSSIYSPNLNAQLGGILGSGNLSNEALRGMTSLYGTTPGMLSLTQQGLLGSGNQGLQLGGEQNQLAGLGIQGAMGAAQVPGNFGQAMGNIGSVLGLGGQVAGAAMGIPSMFNRGPSSNLYSGGEWM